jgi:hypothetical protein
MSEFYKEAKDKEKYAKSVFYGFVFPNKDGIIKYEPHNANIHFVFSSKIIQDNANMYGCEGVNDLPIFCKGWNYGAIDNNCYYYNCKESLEENLNTWRNIALQEKYDFNPWTGAKKSNYNEMYLRELEKMKNSNKKEEKSSCVIA